MSGLRELWDRLNRMAQKRPTLLGLLSLAVVAILGFFLLKLILPHEKDSGSPDPAHRQATQ